MENIVELLDKRCNCGKNISSHLHVITSSYNKTLQIEDLRTLRMIADLGTCDFQGRIITQRYSAQKRRMVHIFLNERQAN